MTLECAEQMGFDNEWLNKPKPANFSEWPQDFQVAYERGAQMFRDWE